MKFKLMVLVLISILLITACGQKTLNEPITLHNQDQQKVTFPLEKPTLFFFITSYT
ncbi:lipoprotein [Neobacillus niacini]|uniref:lipoprotein n=1 Tax=Neobacillus niacini TaxID=86668 RepID=UPI00203DB86E|nr:lipoprotein [Neobacillus niacini]MCM3691298.1 hypothetical protein [Neobacillus niacini]